MKKLYFLAVEAALYVAGWLMVNTLLVFDEINDAISSIFRRRK